ncbi:unnamed protein product [Leptosia nina]|uniref:Regulatory protein zeste n=1 Tax=Leptosia nina TaxID=320188 RepID=A0AAV1J7L7_9NEOP
MKKIASRRSRTPNWSLEEKQFLLDLIKERKEVVVIKPNAPNYYEEKDAAWNEILRALTVKFGTKFCGFSIKKLKTQWQNMKRLAREEVSLNGTAVQKYTRQSFEVCNILELVKDGILTKTENEPFIKPMLKADVEIKTECIDEEIMEASCSGVINCTIQEPTTDTTLMESSSSSAVSDHTEVIDTIEMTPQERLFRNRKTVETMTDPSVIIHTDHIPKDYQSFLRYASCEKDIKMESLKEERQIVKAMRETAELNKIIAEQKLKHFLWIKNQDMA